MPRSAVIFCIGCGYEVTALDRAGNCPECGRAIGESLSFKGAAARRRLPARIRARLGLGLRLVMFGLVFWLLGAVALQFDAGAPGTWPQWDAASAAIFLAALAFSTAGWSIVLHTERRGQLGFIGVIPRPAAYWLLALRAAATASFLMTLFAWWRSEGLATALAVSIMLHAGTIGAQYFTLKMRLNRSQEQSDLKHAPRFGIAAALAAGAGLVTLGLIASKALWLALGLGAQCGWFLAWPAYLEIRKRDREP